MSYFSFVALAVAGLALIYGDENKKEVKKLRNRVEELEQKNTTEEKRGLVMNHDNCV